MTLTGKWCKEFMNFVKIVSRLHTLRENIMSFLEGICGFENIQNLWKTHKNIYNQEFKL